MTVSIKPTASHDSALIVFKGTPVFIQWLMAEFFGSDRVSVAGTPHETLVQAEKVAKAAGYGAKSQARRKAESDQPAEATPPAEATADPDLQAAADLARSELGATEVGAQHESPEHAAPAEPQHPHAELLAQVVSAESKGAIARLLGGASKAAREDADVLAAARARAAELKAA